MKGKIGQERRLCHPAVVSGVLVLSFFLPTVGKSEQTPLPDCPLLPTQGPADTVSVYVAKAQAKPGFVCVRVINGRSESIGYGFSPYVRLQRWEEGRGEQPGQFQDFLGASTLPRGVEFQQLAGKWYSPPGMILDEQVPMLQPAPPGRYRVCFRYDVRGQEERGKQEVCSEEFSLP